MKSLPKFIARQQHVLPVALGLLCLGFGLLESALAPAHAARRPGAPRLLRFNWSDGAPGSILRAGITRNTRDSLSHAVFGVRQAHEGAGGWTLYFTREENGVRNLWRAVPEDNQTPPVPDTSGDETGGTWTGEEREPLLRNVIWRATPLTQLEAGFFADQAAPTPDGRALLCVTNAAGSNIAGSSPNDGARSQIARLDLTSGTLTALTKNTGRNYSPVIAPNGKRFAFVSERDGVATVYVMPIEGGTGWGVAVLAQHPCWRDDSTLIVQSTRSGQTGLYAITLPESGDLRTGRTRLRRIFTRAGEAALSPDGAVLAVASQVSSAPSGATGGTPAVESKLSVLAADGSGERVVLGTEGARSPSFAPDGSAVVFDAPAPQSDDNSTTPVTARSLWLLPMLRVPPTATLLGVRPARSAETLYNAGKGTTTVKTLNNAGKVTTVEILGKATAFEVLGTIFAEDIAAPDVKLEHGAGNEPVQWQPLPASRGPVHEGVILTPFIIPVGATGEWTLRLTVTDAAGDSAQSTLTLSLPIELQERPDAQVPIFAMNLPPGGLPPSAGSPTPANPASSLPAPRANPRAPTVPVVLSPVLPSPTLPSVPSATPRPNPSWISGAPPGAAPARVRELPASSGLSTASALRTTGRTAPGRSATQSVLKMGVDAARVRVRGTPALMRAGETLTVTATLHNTGKQAWASHGSQPVRLIYRWLSAGTGSRVRWALTWLRHPVPPGGSTQLALNLTAPPRPGRYRLTYSLIRLNGTAYEPPPFKARQDRWPGEFGGITYAVVVSDQ